MVGVLKRDFRDVSRIYFMPFVATYQAFKMAVDMGLKTARQSVDEDLASYPESNEQVPQ